MIFRSVDVLDRTAIAYGAVTPLLIWVVISGLAMGWQFMNVERWTGNTNRPG